LGCEKEAKTLDILARNWYVGGLPQKWRLSFLTIEVEIEDVRGELVDPTSFRALGRV
jgi:hypothetical protein